MHEMDPFIETKLERERVIVKRVEGEREEGKEIRGSKLLFGAVPLISLAGF